MVMKLENAQYCFLKFGLFITATCPECGEEVSWPYDPVEGQKDWSRQITCASSHTYAAHGRVVKRVYRPRLFLMK